MAYEDYDSSTSGAKSYFGKTMKIEGEITSDEDVVIEGKLKGQLDVSKTLTIGRSGYVDGKISASVVRISGAADGQLAVSEKLDISAEGKYTGDIKADKIVVAEGAQLKGTINMEIGQTAAAKPATPAPTPTPTAKPAAPKVTPPGPAPTAKKIESTTSPEKKDETKKP